jgi:hypothetical protein
MAKTLTIGKAPRLAISNVNSHRGMEGSTLDADLYLDGKKVGYCLDDGNGGGMRFEWRIYDPKPELGRTYNPATAPGEAAQKARERRDEVEQYIASLSLPPEVVTGVGPDTFEMKQDLEHLVNEAADRWATEKAQRAQFARLHGKNVIYRTPGMRDGSFLTIPLKNHAGYVSGRAQVAAFVMHKHPDAILVETFEQFAVTGVGRTNGIPGNQRPRGVQLDRVALYPRRTQEPPGGHHPALLMERPGKADQGPPGTGQAGRRHARCRSERAGEAEAAEREVGGTKKMNQATKRLLFMGVKQAGTYDPDEALICIEESLTGKEAKEARAFLGWVHSTGKQFGYDTIDDRIQEWKASRAT